MKVYIAGKITGDMHYVDKFREHEKYLKKQGHTVLTPHRLPEGMTFDRVKIGKLNYHHSDVDWDKFGRDAEALCQTLGLDYYIKKNLRKEMEAHNDE